MKSYRTLALKELLSQKVTSILILIADLCGCKPVPDRFDGFSGKSSWQENFLIPDEFPEKHKRSDEFSE